MSDSVSTATNPDPQERRARPRRGRGEGSIEERKGHEGKVRFRVVVRGKDAATGKSVKMTATFDTKKEALAYRDTLLRGVREGITVTSGRATVADWLRQWLEKVKPQLATHSYLAYKRDVNKALIPHLGAVLLRDLNPVRIEAAYAKMLEAGTSAKMVRKAATTLGVALQDAVKKRLLAHNPARDADKPRVPQTASTQLQALDPGQVACFLAAAEADRFFALFVLWLDSGAREGELFALHWPDVDWEGSAITITRALEEAEGKHQLKELKTARSRRRVAIGRFALDALAGHRKRMLAEGRDVKEGPVFCDTRGGFLRSSNFQRRHFDKVLARAGLPDIRPYDLRHTCASLLLLRGVNVKVVSERLGHSTTRLTLDTYQHVLPGMQAQAAAEIDAVLSAPRQRQAGG
jgi:integrase